MNICLFDETEFVEKKTVRLPSNDERAKHILKVLKKKEGDFFESGITGGMAGESKILKIEQDGAIVFSFLPKSAGKPLRPLDLLVGFPRPIQLRRLLRDAAGLGVRRVVLCGTELGEKSYLDSKIVSDGSAKKMLFDGTVQAGSTHVPSIFFFGTLFEAIDFLKEDDVKIALDNKRAKRSLGSFIFENAQKCQNVVAAIGSERGWTENERDFLEKSSFTLCSMGERILRTESAVTVSGAIILNALGFLD